MAALLLLPARSWPLILLAVLPAHLAVERGSGVPTMMVLCWYVSNSCEALMGAAATRFFSRGRLEFDRPGSLGVFFLCGVFLAPVLSSFLDAAFVQLNQWGNDPYWEVWRMRCCSNIFAAGTVGVTILTWAAAGRSATKPLPGRLVEAGLLVLGLVSVSLLVLSRSGARPEMADGLWLYAPLPFLVWAALRFGTRGASATVLFLAALVVGSIVKGNGSFLTGVNEQHVHAIQIFFAALSLTLVAVAALVRERERAEHDLRLGEERYQALVETQPVLVCRYFADGTLSFVNQAYCRFFGRSQKDLIGRKFLDLVPPEARQYLMLGIASIIKERQTVVNEHEVLLPEGGVGWQKWINYPLISADGQIREIQAVGLDLSDHKRTTTALRHSQERFRAITKAVPSSILLVDQSGIVVECHIHDEGLLSKPLTQCVGSRLHHILPRGLADEMQRCLEAVWRSGRMATAQCDQVIGGSRRCFEVRAVRCGAESFLSMVRDVTEQKRAEAALRQSEEKYREVVESQTDLVSRYTPDMTLTFANEAYCRFFGQPRGKLVGRKLLEFIPRDLHVKILHGVADVLAGNPLSTWEQSFAALDGSVRWLHWTDYAIVGDQGQVEEIQGIGKDITDRKRAAEAKQNLIHASRLAVVGEFTAMIAHEINQPLNAILSNTEAAKSLLDGRTFSLDQVRDIVTDIHRDILRTHEAVSRVRALSRRQDMGMEPLVLNSLIQEVVHLADNDAARRHVQIQTELASDLPVVRGDPIHIQHILLNLILNGMDAMSNEPEAERWLLIKTETRGSQEVEVSVKDAGHGVPPELLPRVFESFFTTRAGGMGLGLSISRTIVTAHGGRLWLENNPERGATAHFTLPTDI
jgi:PAS domain S-box-containing protein